MIRRLGSWIVMLIIPLSFATVAVATPTWTVNSLNTIGCNEDDTQFSTTVSGYTGGLEHFRTVVDASGLRYMDEDAGTTHNGSFSWNLYASSSGGPTTATWPLQPNTPITVYFNFISGSGGPVVFQRRVILSQCNGGAIVSDDVFDPPLPLPLPIAAIPTLDEGSVLVLAMLIALMGGMAMRRQSAAAG